MKANEAPEKIYTSPKVFNIGEYVTKVLTTEYEDNIEYTRTDAFVEKALKWYCLDCECNDNCKDTKCFFYGEFKRYLEGETNALPPKISNGILKEDGSTSDKWHYRHFIAKIQDAFIGKAVEYLMDYEFNDSPTIADRKKRVEDFKKYMEK